MQNPIIQQVVETLRGANNVLITVKNSPSVDELTASIALTLILNHMNKHATTVFSGKVPSTIEFLQPEMAIESNTDSLRDFIIALDKSKADKLRYKVEDNVVRIFITPYKSSISEADLEFSQGDFNVDVVVALGVLSRDDFDQAVMAHGRILHDATVVAITNEELQQDVGVVNWQDPQASSVSEMIARITELFGMKVMDSQIATALLTGIVAETDRFKNEKTTPEVLSVSSTLMTEGANQMLIAEELEQPPQIESPFQPLEAIEQSEHDDKEGGDSDGTLSVRHDENEPVGNINIDDHGNINTFGAVGEEPVGQSQQLGAPLPESAGAPSEHDVLPEIPPMSETSPMQGGIDSFGGTTEAASNVVSERPYLEPTSSDEHHFNDEPPIAEPSGLFGNSMHDVTAQQSPTSNQMMFGRGPKVIQPLDQQDTATDNPTGTPPMAAMAPAPVPPVAEMPQLSAMDSPFGSDTHTEDMPGEYQAVASDPIAPYIPPPSVHHDDASAQGALPVVPTNDEQVDEHSVPAEQAMPDVVPDSTEPQTLADIEKKVGSPHVEQAAGLPQPPGETTQLNSDDFMGSVRTPQPATELPLPSLPGTEEPHHDSADVALPATPDTTNSEPITIPDPVVVEPYQPPAPLHEAEKHDDPNSPPQVPPPLTMPQANSSQPVFYDPDGTKNNPFVNPS